MTEDDPGVFVNPYTFVPFPGIAGAPHAHRRAPAGHHLLAAGSFAGEVEVELTAQSPLLLRGIRPTDLEGDGAGAVHRFPRRVFPGGGEGDEGEGDEGEEVPFLPGSTLAGVVRSLHETLAGGCLRVFGEEFRPAYRDAVQARGDQWTLARVEASAPDGRPTALRLCSEVVWVPAKHLAAVLGGAERVRTGATVEVLRSEPVSYGRGQGDRQVSREEARERSWVSAGGDWVVLVTDAGARRPGKGYFCAVGKLGDAAGAAGAAGDSLPVSEAAWTDYLSALVGANDVREDRGGKVSGRQQAEETPVIYRQRDDRRQSLVGYRHRAYPKLFPGQVVWARRGDGEVDGLALSAVWRHVAVTETAGERVPQELLSCQDAAALCPSCRLFGSAETVADAGDDAAKAVAASRQLAYRGHLRFSDARPEGTPTVRREVLAPLGAPRPGAGQFYLEHRRMIPQPHRPALREWGSDADSPRQPRGLRGRKQYWLTARAGERPLFRVSERAWPGNKMASVAESVEAGTRFTFTVRFSGLDLAELGGVLAALDPSLLLGEGTGYAVGGGRPFGFGSCTGRVTAVKVHDAASRYAAAKAPEVSAEGAVAAFRDAADRGVRATWPAVTAALSLDRVEPGTVWYPPQRALPAEGPLTTDDLAAGFGFWKRSSGYRAKDTAYPLIPLPEVTDADQTPRATGGAPPAGPKPPRPGRGNRKGGKR